MTKQEYKKVEFYLYNYHKINYLIKIRETDLIDSINVSNNAWIKSIKDTSNTMEDQAIQKKMRWICNTTNYSCDFFILGGAIWLLKK